MLGRSNILVVAATADLAQGLDAVLSAAGHRITIAKSFESAKRHLDQHPRPDLLISEVKLGEYNGLHLAVRALAVGIPAVVVGDEAFVPDAEQLGAACVAPGEIRGEELHSVVERLIDLKHPVHGPFAWFSDVTGSEEASLVPATHPAAPRPYALN